METLLEAVKDFLDNYVVYDNPHEVEIITNADYSVMVATNWPGENNDEGFNLEIFFECATISAFIETFKLRSIRDLRRITPAFMMSLYEQGKADVCCAVDNYPNYYPMRFRKINQTLVAKDDRDMEHEVPVNLETPQEFRDYTMQCYVLVEC
jgi:hypothetical protein